METYVTAKKYLNSFIDYERCPQFSYKKSLKLERVEKLFKKLKIPIDPLPVVHIAGTKGKGSVATISASMLAHSGLRVGLYTSPHFFDFRERIRIVKRKGMNVESKMISKKDVVRVVRDIKPQLEKLKNDKGLGGVTFFEVYTALAFKYFIQEQVD